MSPRSGSYSCPSQNSNPEVRLQSSPLPAHCPSTLLERTGCFPVVWLGYLNIWVSASWAFSSEGSPSPSLYLAPSGLPIHPQSHHHTTTSFSFAVRPCILHLTLNHIFPLEWKTSQALPIRSEESEQRTQLLVKQLFKSHFQIRPNWENFEQACVVSFSASKTLANLLQCFTLVFSMNRTYTIIWGQRLTHLAGLVYSHRQTCRKKVALAGRASESNGFLSPGMKVKASICSKKLVYFLRTGRPPAPPGLIQPTLHILLLWS